MFKKILKFLLHRELITNKTLTAVDTTNEIFDVVSEYKVRRFGITIVEETYTEKYNIKTKASNTVGFNKK